MHTCIHVTAAATGGGGCGVGVVVVVVVVLLLQNPLSLITKSSMPVFSQP